MYPILFKIGPLEVHSYGFFLALAFLAGILISLRYAKKEGLNPQFVFDLAIYDIIAAIVGARLFYVIGQWDYFRSNLLEVFMVQNGGLVFLGGFFLALAVTLIYAVSKKIPLLKLFDALAPGVSLGYAIARIGCFLNGCCFGVPTNSWLGVRFPPGSLAASYCPGEAVYPTQLYSMTLMFLVFLFLAWLYPRKRFDGQLFFWWLVLYSVYRFLVELIRFSPIYWFGLTPAQVMVIFTFALGVWGLKHYSSKPGA